MGSDTRTDTSNVWAGKLMGSTIKAILFDENGRATSFPFAPFEKALDGDHSILFPDLAGQVVKTAIVFVNTEDRKPVSIRRIEPMLVKFNGRGQVDVTAENDEMELAGKILGGFLSQSSDDIFERLKPDLDAMRYRDKFKWSPAGRQLRTIKELALQ